METANSLSQLGSFEPHGQCFLWNSDLVLLHAISDSITALAYYSIPIALLYFVKKRQDLPYKWMFVVFGAFILACGTTHLMAVWTIWKPDYWLEGTIKGITAATSLVAAGLLWPMIPHALRLPSPTQLDAANQELQKEITVRRHVAAELAGIRQHLERQVQERTADLSRANEALKAEITERKRAEKELLETTQALQALVQASPLSIIALDRQGAVTLWNPASERIFGWREEEVLGRPLPVIPLNKQEEHRAFRERVLNDQAFTGIETRRLKKDGSYIDISLSTAPLRDAGGNIVGVMGLTTDITERKRMEDALRESEERYRLMVEGSDQVFFYRYNQGHRLEYLSPSVRDVLGYEPAEEIGRSYDDLLTGDPSDAIVREKMDGALQDGIRRLPYTAMMRHKDGRCVAFELVESPVKQGNTVVGIQGFARDVTAFTLLENALRAAAAYARNLIEASLDPLATISRDGKITDVNKATEAVTGVPREHLIGSDFSDYFTEPDKAQRSYQQALSEGAVRNYPLTIRHVTGRTTDVLYNATVYCNTTGEVQGVLATAWDITERKQMQAQAAQMERLAAMGQLMGGIAHEIKNPLFIMTGRLQLLKENLANRDYGAVESDIQKIQDACSRMTTITQRFLQLARPFKPQWQSCSVHAVLNQMLDFLANELMKDHIHVVRAFSPDMPPTWSEPRQLHEVFLNLMLNAMQAMVAAHGQGTLTITTIRKDDWIEARIQDDGPGIPPQHRARLFEPFFSTKPPEQGTGLGLWTVRSLLAELNGTVECESVEGQGTTFIVRIPIVSAP